MSMHVRAEPIYSFVEAVMGKQLHAHIVKLERFGTSELVGPIILDTYYSHEVVEEEKIKVRVINCKGGRLAFTVGPFLETRMVQKMRIEDEADNLLIVWDDPFPVCYGDTFDVDVRLEQ